MKFDQNSIRFRIIIPIIGFISIITLVVVIIMVNASHRISKKYFSFTLSRYDADVRSILDTAVNELIVAELLDNEIVVQAKQEVSLDEVALYWSQNNLTGLIIQGGTGEVLYSSVDDALKKWVMPLSSQKGYFHLETGPKHLNLFISDFAAWDWKIITVTEPVIWLKEHTSDIIFLFPVILISSSLMLASVSFILKRNFKDPIKTMISDVKGNRDVRATGIRELDTIGDAINRALRNLMRKTVQYQALHTIATSLHEDQPRDVLLTMILKTANRFIQAELSALLIYDENGKINNILSLGAAFNKKAAFPEGKGLLELIRLSFSPVSIGNVQEHPAFSGSFPEGHPSVTNLIAYPIFSDEGKPAGALFFANKASGFNEEDITILQAVSADTSVAISKAERLAQLKKFKEVIDSAFDIIMMTDANGYITYVNPAFTAVTGYGSAEILGKRNDVLASGSHDKAFYRDLWDTIRSGNAWRGEFINRKKSGELFHTSAVVFPIQSAGGVSYASIQRDITQERQLYEQLLRAQKLEAIGTLAGGIAHDFNNLLTAILGYAEIMLSKTKEGDPFHKPANIIMSAAEQGASLAKKILMVARKEKIETKPVNINDIVINSKELLQRSIPKNIEIILKLAKDTPLIDADPSQIQQVIMNLAVNARDAMPDGGKLTFETEAVGREGGAFGGIPSRRSSGFVKMSVSDTGIGMDSETQRKVFDPFFTTKETGKGTGLGLYIVHSIVANHGGYINLYSEPAVGTRLNIYFPVSGGADIVEKSADEGLRGSGTILVIDDELHVRELCRDLMEPLGYRVVVAEDGAKGLSLFRQLKDEIAVVLLDMIMPKMSGYEVYQALRALRPEVKVIVCSGYSQDGFGSIDMLMKEGAQGVIQKPFTRLTLIRTIAQVISGQPRSS